MKVRQTTGYKLNPGLRISDVFHVQLKAFFTSCSFVIRFHVIAGDEQPGGHLNPVRVLFPKYLSTPIVHSAVIEMVLPSFVTVLLSSFTTLPWIGGAPNVPIPTPSQPPAAFRTQDLSSLLENHLSLIIQGNLTLETYSAIQPTDQQRTAWRNVVTSLLNAADDEHPDCHAIRERIPHELQGIYTVTEVDNGKFCALVEVDTVRRGDDGEEYGKGWGLFVVPTQKNGIGISGTAVHLSAPHPVYDLYTAAQATYVFEWTGAKSLYIPGRSRMAFLEPTDCVVDPKLKTKYWKTDATHDKVCCALQFDGCVYMLIICVFHRER